MGFLVNLFIRIIAFILIMTFLPGLPPNVTYPPFPKSHVIPFTEKLSVNQRLESAEKLFEGKIMGPESFASWENKLYTGSIGGNIISVPDGNVVAQLLSEEDTISVPLGLRFTDRGELLVADASLGLLLVNIKTGIVKTLISQSQQIDGKQFKFVDDLDIDENGNVYLSVASTTSFYGTTMVEAFGEPSGLLVKYNIKKNQSEILMSGIHMANGVQLSPDNKFLLLCETLRSRIIKYYLSGPKKDRHETFAQLPGMCDNLRLESNGHYYVGIVQPSVPGKFNLLTKIQEYPLIRKFVLRLSYLIYLAAGAVNDIYPNSWSALIHHSALSGKLALENMPKYGLVVELNQNGEIVDSLHSPSGNMSLISQANIHGGYLYLASPYNNFIGRIKL